MIRVETTGHGWHLHVFGRRWHHGFTGCLLIVIGAVLACHDLADLAQWWPREEPQGLRRRPGPRSTLFGRSRIRWAPPLWSDPAGSLT
jgi:hypothetical protein